MKNLLLLYTRNLNFTFKNAIFQGKVGAAMGSPLSPLLTGTFLLHLGQTLLPKLEIFMQLIFMEKICRWYYQIRLLDSNTKIIDILNRLKEKSQI